MKILKDLLLAFINATLILVALCLFLLWQLSGTAERVVASFTENLQIVQPLEEKVVSLQTEVQNLRSDLAAMSLESAALNAPMAQRLQSRADALQDNITAINNSLSDLSTAPDRMMSKAIDEATSRVSAQIGALAACHLPSSTGDSVPSLPPEG
ncbi:MULTISPECIES: hypothetical protein [unclassified Shimia]|uniref:hypothetical protein n=1 Tax=unclassified Shimia TaxID=2630038 RepID=UPI003103A9FF